MNVSAAQLDISHATYTLRLPVPNRHLMPNQRFRNVFAHGRLVKERRFEAYCEAITKYPKRVTASKAKLLVVWNLENPLRVDADNLVAWLKSTIDGLTDAKLWTDDRVVELMPAIVQRAAKSESVTMYVYAGEELEALENLNA